MGNVEKDRPGDYFGPIDFKQSLMLTAQDGSVIKADVFHARDDKRLPWRLAFCWGDGCFAGAAGKYAYFRTKRALMDHWHGLGEGEVQP